MYRDLGHKCSLRADVAKEQETAHLVKEPELATKSARTKKSECLVGAHVVDFKKGRIDFVAFCQQHHPQVIVFAIAPSYEENWKFLQLLKNTKIAEATQFLLTTTKREALERLVGGTKAIEILGKPFDLEEILTAVHKLLHDEIGRASCRERV